jgi:hypothetical protein
VTRRRRDRLIEVTAPSVRWWCRCGVDYLNLRHPASVEARDAGGCVVRPDKHLTYMIDIALTTEFPLAAGGARECTRGRQR